MEGKRTIDLGPEQKKIFMERLKRDVNVRNDRFVFFERKISLGFSFLLVNIKWIIHYLLVFMILNKVVLVSKDFVYFVEIFVVGLERDQTISAGDMNTSDLSGNESSEDSGKILNSKKDENRILSSRKSNTNRR